MYFTEIYLPLVILSESEESKTGYCKELKFVIEPTNLKYKISVIKIPLATDTSLRLPTAGRFSMTSMVVSHSYGQTHG
jgi:hypothetical protein